MTLYLLEGQTGGVTLNVHDPAQRKVLLEAQIEHRPLTVKFAPTKNGMRPDKDTREGLLLKITWFGPTQGEIIERYGAAAEIIT